MTNWWFVIAGNHFQYLQFVKQKVSEGWPDDTSLSMSNFHYVDHPDKLRGFANPRGYFIGTWRNREDIEDIVKVLCYSYTSEKMHDNLKRIINEVLSN